MNFVIGVAIFVVGLLISIALHEIGHLAPAKRFGVKVPEYFVGFGPTLWSGKRGETEYGIKGIPLGGYVRLAGMYPPAAGSPRRDANGRLSLIEEAREDARKDLAPGEEHRAFSALTVPRKLVVMFGGPFMNWMIALVLLVVVVAGIGVAALTPRVSEVGACVPSDGVSECAAGDPASPASAAGFQVGDRIDSWGGTPVATWADVQDAIRSGGTGAAPVVIERDEEATTLTVTPVMLERPVVGEDGAPLLNDAGDPVMEEVPYVGISPSVELQRQGLSDAIGMWWDSTGRTFAAVGSIPAQLWDVVSSWFGGDGGDRSLISIVGVGRVAGDITAAASTEYTFAMRMVDMLGLLASLNLALFVFNLIPLPPLDGGHIAGAIVEGVRKGWARLTSRTDPGPVDMARTLPLTYAVFGVLVVMSAILIAADIVNPVAL